VPFRHQGSDPFDLLTEGLDLRDGQEQQLEVGWPPETLPQRRPEGGAEQAEEASERGRVG
jgi:hypothetical protein